MDGRRRMIEVDEDIAAALEQGAVERGLSVDQHLSAMMNREQAEIELAPDDHAELLERIDAWERDRLGAPLQDVADWMRSWGRPDELPRPRVRRL